MPISNSYEIFRSVNINRICSTLSPRRISVVWYLLQNTAVGPGWKTTGQKTVWSWNSDRDELPLCKFWIHGQNNAKTAVGCKYFEESTQLLCQDPWEGYPACGEMLSQCVGKRPNWISSSRYLPESMFQRLPFSYKNANKKKKCLLLRQSIALDHERLKPVATGNAK